MAIEYVVMQGLGRLDQCSGGTCASGNFASVVFWSQKAHRTQIWFISNGRDLITVTHICRVQPDSVEVLEADQIAKNVEIAPNWLWDTPPDH